MIMADRAQIRLTLLAMVVPKDIADKDMAIFIDKARQLEDYVVGEDKPAPVPQKKPRQKALV